ncbi:ABC transporter ATP-binding protein [Paenibacillus sp. 7124]|uniref:ABC transporter ATP-binding protein n=1 Tax=Paenibacillus apii TaxID=1850370 RepID=A0A6M1PTC0_9BACL|nr:ABC transporter ATP-binding protein [Paenibacillus apii]NGM85604.1 ABC transporter ATP-binding protein [Paenibacillus apii]NJJ40698.1 ABC transporter ATP-binding protein [Paenibacillus apii]
MTILEVKNLKKSFGEVKAVQDISFTVEAGEVFTIIGPNGAGKTTTLEMIEGLQPPDAGSISIAGFSWDKNESEIKTRIGVQPQSSALFDLLTAEENLDLFASFYPKSKSTAEVLEMINLTEHRNKRVKSLSGGQRQRLAIGLAMINDPQVIFLDEPTTGLDPQARRNIWDIILQLKQLGATIILTTHYMEEAEKLSDRVCIVDQGTVISLDTPAALIGKLTREREVRLSFFDGEAAAARTEQALRDLPEIVRMERDGENLTLWSPEPEQALYGLLGFTKEQGYRVEHVSIREMSLEDVFITFTGKEWRD